MSAVEQRNSIHTWGSYSLWVNWRTPPPPPITDSGVRVIDCTRLSDTKQMLQPPDVGVEAGTRQVGTQSGTAGPGLAPRIPSAPCPSGPVEIAWIVFF